MTNSADVSCPLCHCIHCSLQIWKNGSLDRVCTGPAIITIPGSQSHGNNLNKLIWLLLLLCVENASKRDQSCAKIYGIIFQRDQWAISFHLVEMAEIHLDWNKHIFQVSMCLCLLQDLGRKHYLKAQNVCFIKVGSDYFQNYSLVCGRQISVFKFASQGIYLFCTFEYNILRYVILKMLRNTGKQKS